MQAVEATAATAEGATAAMAEEAMAAMAEEVTAAACTAAEEATAAATVSRHFSRAVLFSGGLDLNTGYLLSTNQCYLQLGRGGYGRGGYGGYRGESQGGSFSAGCSCATG